MSKLLKRLAFASAFACLATGQPAFAQQTRPGDLLEPPAFGMPQIFDATKTRVVGSVLPPESTSDLNRTLLTFSDGVAVIFMTLEGFMDGPSTESAVKDIDLGAYYSAADCSSPPYMRVKDFLTYGKFIPAAEKKAGYSQGGLALYPARPFVKATLVAQRQDSACKPLSEPIPDASVGVVARARVPAYKLPFFTK